MITLNAKKKERLTLVAVYDTCKDIPELVCKKDGAITLISEENKYYMYFKNCGRKCPKTLYCKLLCFFKNNKHSLNIDVCSFKKIAGCKTIQTIAESVLYATHEEYSLKTVCKEKKECKDKEEMRFNLICKCPCEDSNEKKCDKPCEKMCSMPMPCEKKCDKPCETIVIDEAWCASKLEEAIIKMEYVNFARDLQDMPPNKCYSTSMADAIVKKASKIKGIKITVLDKKAITENKMNLVLGVNAGSKHDPRVVVLEYNGNPGCDTKIGLVGKGVTFDTGGYNLKPSMFMKGMKFDMSGAAIATSALMAIAKAGLKVNYTAVACIVDNVIGAEGTIPESVITSMNGKTVQIDNTDAEGRLILADGITYSIRKLGVTKIIEMSTLTGAILIALGDKITGVYTNCDKLWCCFKKAAECAAEDVWRMPLHCEFDKIMTTTPIADVSNAPGSRMGGANQAAAFLKQFTEDKPFIHLDIAGTATTKDQRGRGVMVRTLFTQAKKIAECGKKECPTKE